ncbi:UNVERIFIED_CONTAM: Wall-associated receptor kinase [Sesamum angustifolium]|uniref:Wall-associated receptor kinase n=1 Tax=Sesamum angustifolium TaxID=2727405 RepID=A0AAW2J2X1_9LAMI
MEIRSLLLFTLLHIPWTLSYNFTSIYSTTSFAEGPNIAKPGCPSKCGDLSVPYPFGIGIRASCSINHSFDIKCNSSFDPPKAFLGNLEVVGISETQIRIKNHLASICNYSIDNSTFALDLSGTPFSLSNQNKLTVVGCNHVSLMSKDSKLDNYISSCIAVCSKPQELSDGSCSGIGCCQASIPKGLQYIATAMLLLNNQSDNDNFNPCGYSFLAEQNRYSFRASDISDASFVKRTMDTVPLVIDWAIANRTCNESSNIICEGESVCVDPGTTIGGYRCNCSRGYQGNPYLSPGCQDVNECEFNPCHPKAICINLPGSFNCSCPPNYLGDGAKYGSGCIFLPPPNKTALYTGLFIGSGLFILLAVSLWLYKVLRKRRAKQLKQSIFKQNGGLLLQQHISAHDLVLGKMRIFTSKELEKATDRFNESRILGRGGQGTVYKGMLSDGRIVAVKKSKQVDENRLEEFINETHLTTKVQGTFGYLDPEYFQTSKFTEKSDVYSFGVVLVELLTGQKPISTSVTDEEKSLVTRFVLTMEENRLHTILDSQITEQGSKEEHLAVANLARRCLKLNGKKRPTIREVAMELESIRACENPSCIESNTPDISFMEEESSQFPDDGSSQTQNTFRRVNIC